MKMRCISRCQFKGDIVRIGQEIEIDDATLKSDPIAKSSFAPADPAAATRRPESTKIVAGLTRKQALLKLASMKVPCDDAMRDEEIVALFNRSVDAKAHAAK